MAPRGGRPVTGRYARQMVLPEVGVAGQARLASASVLVVGAGGLGSPVLATLAGAGVGRLTVLDHDSVEESNLHRQPLYRLADLGRLKAEAARDALLAANPGIAVAALPVRLGVTDAPGLVAEADLVLDCADSLAVTYVLSDACHTLRKPLVSASVLGLSGYVGAFCGGAPSYRAVFPDMPSTVGSCAANGVLGSTVAVLGGLQAHLALQLLLGLEPSPLGRLVSVDLRNLAFGGFDFADAVEPDGRHIPFLARGAIAADDLVVELRGMEEAPEPVTPDAMRIDPDELDAVPTGRRIVLCCASGVRAHRAARRLAERGHSDVAVLALILG
jgi:molybdopterin/thiamine biosynthesis adenylyltransferase/rhodanese-related sulfurtransferase